jgi:beta-glucuronidase
MIRPQTNAHRDVVDLSGVWRIRFDPDDRGEAQGWAAGIGEGRAIAVPGSWNEQLAEAGYMNYVGAAWYETEFWMPAHAADKRITLRFGSADYAAQVFVDGALIGRSGPAHLPFELEVHGAKAGERHRLVVWVDNRLPEDGPMQRVTRADYAAEGRARDEYLPAVRFDFFPYGGLARPVHLTITPKRGFRAVRVRTKVTPHGGVLTIACDGELDGVVRVLATASLLKGAVSSAEAPPGSLIELNIPDCPLWSPQSPTLIPLRVEALNAAGEPLDQVDLRVGVRDVRVEGDCLLLNSEAIQLRGFGKHEDSAIRGRGLDLPLLVKDFEILNWIGANSVRTSHYPYAEDFYDFCDENGILVIDEVFSINLDFRKVTAQTLALHKEAVAALIERDGNRPCVIAWSLANEPGYLAEAAYQESGPYWRELYAYARSLDATRPLTHANVDYAGPSDPAYAEDDFISINRYYGWYKHPAQLDAAIVALEADFARLAERYHKPIFVSEFGADALAGEHATYPQLFTEDYQSDLVEAYWRAIEAHPGVIGGHVWNFADFRTAQHGRRVVLNLKGVFTRDRQPKRAAMRLREMWSRTNKDQ